jgi:hypothetical protein
MKTLCVCASAIVIPLIGGCTAPQRATHVETIVEVIQPDRVTRYHIPDSPYYQTLKDVKQTLERIEEGVEKTLVAVARRKAPTSGDLATIKGTLEEIDLKVTEVRTALDIASRRVPISGDAVQIITYLRPRLNVQLDPNVLYSDKKIRLTFNVTNRGEHSVCVGEPQLTLSTDWMRGKDITPSTLSPDVDYMLQWEPGGSCVAAGQTIKRIADIEIRQAELDGRPLYYSLRIDTETEPEIVGVLSGLLLDSLETYKLHRMSRASFTFAGEVSPSSSGQPE